MTAGCETEKFIGIEIGGTKLQAVVADATGNVSQSMEVAADSAGGAEAILRQVERIIQELISSEVGGIRGAGIGFGGPVDAETGIVIKSNHVAGWENVPLVDWVEKYFQLPCAVGNDTDVATVAEARLGSGKNKQSVFYTNIGSGIGGGLVMDGMLYSRPNGAMEFGHTTVYSKLEKRFSILEEFCSGWSLTRRAQKAAGENRISLLWELSDNHLEGITAETLFQAWISNDRCATRVVEDFLECYSRGLANVIAVLNPDVIVIGGGVAQVGPPLLDAIRGGVRQHVYEPFADRYRIEFSSLGKLVVPLGAVLWAKDRLG